MKRADEIKLIRLMGGKVVPFSKDMRKALKKGEVVCPHGNSGEVRHIEYESVERGVLGVNEGGIVEVQSHFDCEGSGEALHFTCACTDCYKEHQGGLHWFLPANINVEYL